MHTVKLQCQAAISLSISLFSHFHSSLKCLLCTIFSFRKWDLNP